MFERLKRPNYFAGRVLSAADLRAEQDYVRNRIARHNRLLHGAGVVSGLQITAKASGLVLSPGLALDCEGNEIVIDNEQVLPLPNGLTSPQFLVVRYAETTSDPVATSAGNAEAANLQESFALSCQPADPLFKRVRHGKLRCACGQPHPINLGKAGVTRRALAHRARQPLALVAVAYQV